MSIRRFSGLQTLMEGAVFWTDLVNERGWRIQYNRTLDVFLPLKPFRLLDPNGVLWASADEAEELANELPNMVAEFAQKDPLIDQEMVQDIMATVAKELFKVALKSATQR